MDVKDILMSKAYPLSLSRLFTYYKQRAASSTFNTARNLGLKYLTFSKARPVSPEFWTQMISKDATKMGVCYCWCNCTASWLMRIYSNKPRVMQVTFLTFVLPVGLLFLKNVRALSFSVWLSIKPIYTQYFLQFPAPHINFLFYLGLLTFLCLALI